MAIQDFRSYDLAVAIYRRYKPLRIPAHLKDQLLRASSSVVLSLSEGSARSTLKDRLRFYTMAFASLRLDIDRLAAHLYRLTRS